MWSLDAMFEAFLLTQANWRASVMVNLETTSVE